MRKLTSTLIISSFCLSTLALAQSWSGGSQQRTYPQQGQNHAYPSNYYSEADAPTAPEQMMGGDPHQKQNKMNNKQGRPNGNGRANGHGRSGPGMRQISMQTNEKPGVPPEEENNGMKKISMEEKRMDNGQGHPNGNQHPNGNGRRNGNGMKPISMEENGNSGMPSDENNHKDEKKGNGWGGWFGSNSNEQQTVVDRSVTAQFLQKLRADPTISKNAKGIHVTADDGIVTLEGRVANEYESNQIEAMARNIQGVRGVTNNLTTDS